MVKKLLVVFVVALVIAAAGFVPIATEQIFRVDWTSGPRGGLIVLGITVLVGLYWFVKVYIPGQIKKRQQNAQRNQDT